jgi:DNA-binding LacI/PurR family transcriptional regulator
VPDDISIACFDAINQGDMYGTQFTCVMQPVERIGREVAELLIRKSRGDIPEGQFVKKIVPYELVFGNSVKKL